MSAEYSLETSRHEGLDLLEGAVDAMDIRGDKHKFMDTHNQIFCPPACFDYQPHMGDEVSHHKQGFFGALCGERLALLSLLLVGRPLVRFFVSPNHRCVSSAHSSLSRQSC